MANETNESNVLTIDEKQKILVITNDQKRGDVFFNNLEKNYNVIAQKIGPELYQLASILKPSLFVIDTKGTDKATIFQVLKTIDMHPNISNIPIAVISNNEDLNQEIFKSGSGFVYTGEVPSEEFFNFTKTILDNSNFALVSNDQRVHYYICYNEQSKNDYLKSAILTDEIHDVPVLVLSWRKGVDFFHEELEAELLLESDLITYLEIKPSVISKFPYIQDPTPIINEIIKFCPHKPENVHLVFEEPRHLLNIHLKENSITKAYTLSTMLNSTFKKITYVNTKPQEKSAALFINKIGKILTGTSGA